MMDGGRVREWWWMEGGWESDHRQRDGGRVITDRGMVTGTQREGERVITGGGRMREWSQMEGGWKSDDGWREGEQQLVFPVIPWSWPVWCHRCYLQCSGQPWSCQCHSRRCTFPRCSSPLSWWPAVASCRPTLGECSWRERFLFRLWTIWHQQLPCSAHRTESPRLSRRRCNSGAWLWSTSRPLQEDEQWTVTASQKGHKMLVKSNVSPHELRY